MKVGLIGSNKLDIGAIAKVLTRASGVGVQTISKDDDIGRLCLNVLADAARSKPMWDVQTILPDRGWKPKKFFSD